MKLLCRCDDSSAAEAIRLRLDAAGIQALVNGVDSIHVGLEASGAKVEVNEQDFDRALQLLLADRRNIEQAGSWVCSDCEERNEGAFEICWNCQKPRDDIDERLLLDEAIEALPEPTVEPPSTAATSDIDNPYRPVLLTENSFEQNQRRRERFAITMVLIVIVVYLLFLSLFT